MRKLKYLLSVFSLPIILIVVSLFLFFGVNLNVNILPSEQRDNYLVQMIATLLGVAVSIFTVEGFKKIEQRKRVKKTFGILKVVVVKYLRNLGENILATVDQFTDILEPSHAEAFLIIASNFDKLSSSIDKEWFKLVYSQDFLDLVNSDAQFNKIYLSVLETLFLTKTLSSEAVNAGRLTLIPDAYRKEDWYIALVLKTAREIRDDTKAAIQTFLKYVDKLEEEIDDLLKKMGVGYSEFER